MSSSTRTALITGASAGIGEAFARVLAREGYNLVLVARRLDRLAALASELSSTHGVEAVAHAADLASPTSLEALHEALEQGDHQIDVLINNAGYSLNTKFCESPWSEHADALQVMLMGLTQACHLFAPGMKARGWGRILNVSSVAAFLPPYAGNLYSGIKSYVHHLSLALDLELKPHGVHVTSLCPGFTYSEFHDVMGTRDLVERLPKLLWMSAEQVAEQGYLAVMRGDPVCINGKVNTLMAGVSKLLPERLRYELSKRSGLFE